MPVDRVLTHRFKFGAVQTSEIVDLSIQPDVGVMVFM